MKKILIGLLLISPVLSATAQQVARARHVQLVTTTSPSSPLQVISKGGISFIGSSTFAQHGTFTLLSNPISGNSDWLDSTTGVLTAGTTGMVNFRGTIQRQNITGPTTFYGITIDGVGVNLNQSNEVRNLLGLSNGLIYVTNRDDSIYISNPALASLTYNADPFTTTSWVHGKLSRRTNVVQPSIYEFPIGKIKDGDSLYAPIKFAKQNGNLATYSAQYFPDTPVNRTMINPYFDHISILEFWEITSHNFAALADNYAKLSLSWRTYSDVSSVAAHRDSLAIAHYIDPGPPDEVFIWEPEVVSPLAIIEPGHTENWGYFNNDKFIGDFSMRNLNFTIGTRTIYNALPVHLIDYQVQLTSDNTVLNKWKVTNDVDVARYEVERSVNSTTFNKLGQVASVRYTGLTDYNFTDPSPVRGWNYYRLKIIEDNSITYSPTRKVFIGGDNIFTIFPNPAGDHIFVNLPPLTAEKGLLSLIDNSGRLISTLVPPSTTVRVSLTNLAAGVYYIRYQVEGNVYSKAFVHQN